MLPDETQNEYILHFFKVKSRPSCFKYEKFITWLNYFKAVAIETREKDRLKDISFYIETLWESLVVDKRWTHWLCFLRPERTLRSQRAVVSELHWSHSTNRTDWIRFEIFLYFLLIFLLFSAYVITKNYP